LAANVTPTLPVTGAADGVPGMVALAAVLLLTIFMVRRIRFSI
jgi:LPXTG-motif cell wall-anchored protein